MKALHSFLTGRRVALTPFGWVIRRGFRTVAGPTRWHADVGRLL